MTAGVFIAFIVTLIKLYDPVRRMSGINNSFQQAFGASGRIFEILALDTEKDNGHEIVRGFRNSIVFDDVHFGYESGTTVLNGISFSVQRGEVVAIVGPSGAGKSTLVHLIPRFFDVTSGLILIDAHDVRDLTLASLRSQVGIVTQETILFNDTVRNNIAYGQPDVSQGMVEAAAKMALAHGFIEMLPDGYNSVIGERGVRLSGGERQRLAIARAILKNAPILILDEATSALDSESESLVQAALQNLMQGRTVFVIAHRLSTVRHADRIVVLDAGTIADIGRHEELMNRLGTYRRLYELQFIDVDAHKNAANGNGVCEPALAEAEADERIR
jgi:subfamily B ATP-binding cassette protein MsbA